MEAFLFLLWMTKEFTDQLGMKIRVEFPPRRIISLVPSQTELLCDLGLSEEVVGITKFCERPIEWFKSKEKVGGTKSVKVEMIESLRPDLIIGNKEENDRNTIDSLKEKYPVWMSDIITFQDAIKMIRSVGDICNRSEQALSIAKSIQSSLGQLLRKEGRVLYLIWHNPWMGVGSDTFINSMLSLLGYTNVLADKTRYPELSIDQILNLNPQHVFFSSEPFPFKDEHMAVLKERLPNANIRIVDGQFFSWYGSRLLKAANYFNQI